MPNSLEGTPVIVVNPDLSKPRTKTTLDMFLEVRKFSRNLSLQERVEFLLTLSKWCKAELSD